MFDKDKNKEPKQVDQDLLEQYAKKYVGKMFTNNKNAIFLVSSVSFYNGDYVIGGTPWGYNIETFEKEFVPFKEK